MSKETILVVDDEQNIIELARLYLEQDAARDRRVGSMPPRTRQWRALHEQLARHHVDGA